MGSTSMRRTQRASMLRDRDGFPARRTRGHIPDILSQGRWMRQEIKARSIGHVESSAIDRQELVVGRDDELEPRTTNDRVERDHVTDANAPHVSRQFQTFRVGLASALNQPCHKPHPVHPLRSMATRTKPSAPSVPPARPSSRTTRSTAQTQPAPSQAATTTASTRAKTTKAAPATKARQTNNVRKAFVFCRFVPFTVWLRALESCST